MLGTIILKSPSPAPAAAQTRGGLLHEKRRFRSNEKSPWLSVIRSDDAFLIFQETPVARCQRERKAK